MRVLEPGVCSIGDCLITAWGSRPRGLPHVVEGCSTPTNAWDGVCVGTGRTGGAGSTEAAEREHRSGNQEIHIKSSYSVRPMSGGRSWG